MRKLVVLLLVISLLGTPAFAYTVPNDTIVYVTRTGEKYHREGCSYLSSSRSMTIAAAERKGYTPCSRCNPDTITGIYTPNEDSGDSEKPDSSATADRNKDSDGNGFDFVYGLGWIGMGLAFVVAFLFRVKRRW